MYKLSIGLDLDGVVCDFVNPYEERFGKNNPNKIITKHCKNILQYDKDFWLNLPIINKPNFEVTLYCTARCNNKQWNKEFLRINNFPKAPIYQRYSYCLSKAPLIKGRCQVFIDDSIKNVIDLNKNGIPCLLMDSPYNQEYGPIGRIYSLDYEEIEDVYNMFINDIFPYYAYNF